MSGGTWDILGIAPTSDETTIRRAYATLVKRVRPDEDAEGFRNLRGAYEAAMRGVAQPAAAHEATAERGLRPAPEPEQRPAPAPAAPDLEPCVAALIREGDTDAAAAMLLAARGDNTLPLGPWMRLSDLLARRLVQDTAVAESKVERMATDFGWYGPGAQPVTPVVKTLRMRIDAAHWIATVRADAVKWTRFFGNDKAAASAMLLGRGRLGLAGLLPPYHELVTLLSGVEVHGAWAARRLDEDRVARLRNLALDKEGQLRRRLTALVATAVAFGAAGSLQAGFLCAMVMLRMRIAWLRRFVMLALPLAAATAAATASCDELAVRGVFYCVAALCLGYFGAAWVAFAKAMVRGGWRQPSLRILALVPALTACFLWATWAWPGAAPILREYGLNNLTGPLALIVALFLLRSIFKRATGGGSDSMPRW